MKSILINSKEIESCWETNDVCFVKTTTGRVWLCQKKYPLYGVSTYQYIKSKFKELTMLELPLAQKGKSE